MGVPFYLPPKIYPVFVKPDGTWRHSRYKDIHGGRGSAKSHTVAEVLVARADSERQRLLCTRENQNSIQESVHRLLVDKIYKFNLQNRFHITDHRIESRVTGSEFIFKGLRHNIQEIKSLEGVTICWIEEAAKVSANSWKELIPTIRKKGSEIILTWNPDLEEDETYRRFIEHPPDDCISLEMNFMDNPYFNETALPMEMEYDKRVDFEKYEHIWLGKTKKYANALIFRGKFRVATFETPANARFFFGSDFGFSTDPSCLIRMFILDRTLYIDYEAYGYGVELDQLHEFYSKVPDSGKWKITADSARPDTISFLARPFTDKHGKQWPGYNIVGAEKGKGSVEDGIQFLRGFEEIVIHTRCPYSARDFSNYKWKVDKNNLEIIPEPAEGSDHSPDASRYGLESYIKRNVTIFDLAPRTK